jgi:hypothetical protein
MHNLDMSTAVTDAPALIPSMPEPILPPHDGINHDAAAVSGEDGAAGHDGDVVRLPELQRWRPRQPCRQLLQHVLHLHVDAEPLGTFPVGPLA